MRKGTGVLSLFAFLFLCLPTVSYGQLITISITAVIKTVTDADNLLEGNVSVGDTIAGTYTYDTSAIDTEVASETALYSYSSLPCGITLTVGGVVFASNPSSTNFTICIQNAEPADLFNDSYGIRSYSNSSILNEVQVESLSWTLTDYSNTAISDTTLSTTAPNLSDWDDSILYIGGGTGGTGSCYDETFYIAATVTSAVLVPEPTSIVLLGIGLLALRKQK